MRIKLLLIGLGITGVFAVSTMLAQTTATSPATKPATASAPTSQSTTTTSAPATTSAASTCLKCHPWEKVVAGSKDWKSPLGDKVNPHYYVPHTSKKAEDIPDCLKCHTAHALPPKDGEIDLKKMDVKWCYTACHHEKNFIKCDKCH
jgi:hypothetical protein